MEADIAIRVNQSVAVNTFMTHPLHSFSINGTSSHFAVTKIVITALVTKTLLPPGPETDVIEENYDGAIALIVCGGICGSIVLILCIVGIVKLATRNGVSSHSQF